MTSERDMRDQIERDERWLAGLLEATPTPSAEVAAQVRQAVVVECERAVLDRFEDPTPDPSALEGVRAAVRRELRRPVPWAASARTLRIFGAVAAAACVVIAVGLVHFVVSGPTRSSERLVENARTGGPDLARERTKEIVEDMSLAFQSVGSRREVALSILADEIDRLAMPSLDDPADSVETELGVIGNAIEDLFAESVQPSET